jgi:hypothetical protein
LLVWTGNVDKRGCMTSASYTEHMEHIGGQLQRIEQNMRLNTADPVALHGFTQLPNFILRNPDLSANAKTPMKYHICRHRGTSIDNKGRRSCLLSELSRNRFGVRFRRRSREGLSVSPAIRGEVCT